MKRLLLQKKLSKIVLWLCLSLNTTISAVGIVTPTNYAYFKIIVDRNIFDQSHGTNKVTITKPVVETLSLTGTLLYSNHRLAFFDSVLVVKVNDKVHGLVVKEIEDNYVKLLGGSNEIITLKVSGVMQKIDNGEWKAVEPSPILRVESPVFKNPSSKRNHSPPSKRKYN